MDSAAETSAENMDYFKEIAALHDKYANVDYIHINIPIGADAISKYENTIIMVV